MSAASPSFALYSRVPSPSNVADEPSRMAPLLLMQNEAEYRVSRPVTAEHGLADYCMFPIAVKLSQMSAFTWFSRVPSHSNPADAPSRLIFEGAACLGALQVDANFALPVSD